MLTELVKRQPNPRVVRWAELQPLPLDVSVVTVEEIHFGLASRPNAEIRGWFETFFEESCRILEITELIAVGAGTLRGALRKQGRKVFAVDPSASEIEGDKAYPDLASLPEKVEAVVLEVPKQETEAWVRQAADAGIRDVWIHMTRETPEAVALAKQRGLNVLTGTCAVMYVTPGFTYHTLHKWVNQLTRQY